MKPLQPDIWSQTLRVFAKPWDGDHHVTSFGGVSRIPLASKLSAFTNP